MFGGQGTTEYLAFLDECGDHSLTKTDKDFPIFVLSLVIARRSDYIGKIIPQFNGLKLRYWDHEGVNLHSRDIRQANGPFAILQNVLRRETFMADLSGLMSDLPYTLFVVCIRKDKLCRQYVNAENPYELALTFVMERVVYWMEHNSQACLPIIAEARGKNEDNSLKATFFDLLNHGTPYIADERFKKLAFNLQFHNKMRNIAGIQLADLCAHPVARHVLKPEQPNRAFELIKPHVYRRQGVVSGWKVFP